MVFYGIVIVLLPLVLFIAVTWVMAMTKPGDPAENWRLSNATSDGELRRPPS